MDRPFSKTRAMTRKSRSFSVVSSAWSGLLAVALSYSSCFAAAQSAAYPDSGSAKAAAPLVHMPLLSQPGAADRLISLDFDHADICAFIKTVGHLTGINFLIDENVRGTVTLVSPTKIRVAEVYSVLESILQIKGYAAVPVGRIVKIVPRAEAAKSNLLIRVGSDPDLIPIDDSVVTQIIPLRFADATEVSNLVSPLVSTGGNVAPYPKTNSIIVTDASATIHRIASLLGQLDVEGASDNIEVIPLKYASAVSISEQIIQIMQYGSVSPRTRRTQPPATGAGPTIKILPDDRTNSLIIVANSGDLQTVKSLVEKLDVERPLEASNVHVVYLEHAKAKEVEDSLSKVLGKLTTPSIGTAREPVQITSDESTNSLIVVASPQDYTIIKDMIDKLDVVREQVLVEFQIVEASEDTLREIGVDWATLDEAVADSIRGFAFTNFGPRVEAISGDLEGLGVGLYKQVGDESKIGAILKALERHTGVNFLSTPHVVTSNHQEASITVADNVPYVSQSRVTEFDPATPTAIRTYDFKDVGIDLKVTPHISQSGRVRLEIDASFSKLIESATGLGAETPTTANRKANTVVSIMSGTTVVIGGLMRDDKETVEKKIPLLADIPLIGGLFKVDRDRVQKTNLLLFITPHVLTGREDLDEITETKKQQVEQSTTNAKG